MLVDTWIDDPGSDNTGLMQRIRNVLYVYGIPSPQKAGYAVAMDEDLRILARRAADIGAEESTARAEKAEAERDNLRAEVTQLTNCNAAWEKHDVAQEATISTLRAKLKEAVTIIRCLYGWITAHDWSVASAFVKENGNA